MSDEENKISMNDNNEKGEDAPQETEEGKGGAKGESQSWYAKPESMGNNVGDKIQSGLSPVGKATGPVFEKGAGVLGGIIEPVVGGVMKSGKGFGDTVGVGFGNAEGGPAKQQEAEHERMKERLGGKEQTGDNPLGL